MNSAAEASQGIRGRHGAVDDDTEDMKSSGLSIEDAQVWNKCSGK